MHEFSAKDIDGHMVNLDKYRGYVCIVTNEPGSNAEIKEFAAGYNVKFDLFSKICVNGDDAHPLWKWMKVQPKGKGILGNAIKWNFTKFLIDKNGCVVKRYGPMEEPLVIEKDLPCYL
ncbi:phospholipid hydroperoxide glutathione peroxidase, mitochondrial precursor [Camelus ferus]|nr:phospholipid hydroperoxide glutathione peroxidase, mitochondrial precursor [Camelus ferus]